MVSSQGPVLKPGRIRNSGKRFSICVTKAFCVTAAVFHRAACGDFHTRRSGSGTRSSVASSFRAKLPGTGRGRPGNIERESMFHTPDTLEHSQQSGELAAYGRSLLIRWVFPSDIVHDDIVNTSHTVVGRAADCRIRLDCSSASRHHAEIKREGVIFVVRDLDSTNGTFLNGTRVQHNALSPGDVLRVGNSIGIVSYVSDQDSHLGFTELAPGLWGGDQFARHIEPIQRASNSALPILILGETGTGKERVARSIHLWSARGGPFCAINCGAVPPDLAEAELFGYRKGAFTGADHASLGYFRAADTGTLLLDEIGDLQLSTQAKLLRILEQRVVTPLGQTQAIPVDVRIVAAGRHPLGQLVLKGAFREDLHARLAGLVAYLTPLRQRREDILPLFSHFLTLHAPAKVPDLHPRFAERLCLHYWAGNVRELELLARRLLVLHGHADILRSAILPREWGQQKVESTKQSPGHFSTRREQDLHLLLSALKRTRGNVKAAALSLGFSRQRAYRLLAGRRGSELIARCGTDDDVAIGEQQREGD